MVAFCTSVYGEKTTGTFETPLELKHYVDNPGELDIIPVQMCRSWPPVPPGPQEGCDLCSYVFGAGQRLYMNPIGLAKKIYDHIKGLGLLAEVTSSLPGTTSCSVPETVHETVWNMKVSDPHILSGYTLLDDGQINLARKSVGRVNDLSVLHGYSTMYPPGAVLNETVGHDVEGHSRGEAKPLGAVPDLRALYEASRGFAGSENYEIVD